MGVARGANQVGHDAQGGKTLLDALHAGCNGGIVHGIGIDLVVGHVHLLGSVGFAVGQDFDDQELPVVVGAVIGVLDVGLAGAASGLDDQVLVVNGRDGELGLVVGQGHVGSCHRLLHVRDVKDVAHDNGLAAKQLEVGVHELAEGIAPPVIRVAQLLHRLGPAGAEDGDASRSGRRRALHGGRADDEGHAAGGDNGSADAGGLLGDKYAVICHCFLSSLSAGGQLHIVHMQQVPGGLDFDAVLGERVAGDDQ